MTTFSHSSSTAFSHPSYSLEDRKFRIVEAKSISKIPANASSLLFQPLDEEIGKKGKKYESLSRIPSFREDLPRARSDSFVSEPVKEDHFLEAINKAIDMSNGKIDLQRKQLSFIPKTIGDLKYCVSLTASFSFTPILGTRTLARTQSVPFSIPSNQGTATESSTFTKTQSSSSLFSKSKSSAAAVPLSFFLSHNNLTYESFPAEFFKLENLTMLTLLDNKLERISEGLGRLTGLTELNLSSNKLQWLPAEIMQLGQIGNLKLLRLAHNPWLKAPTTPLSKSKRLLSPLVTKFNFLSLQEITKRKLLGPSPWEDFPLFQESFISEQLKSIPPHLAAPFSSFFIKNSIEEGVQPFDPASNICSSKNHDEPVYYVEHAEERFEWVSSASIFEGDGRGEGKKEFPIRHRGCSSGCLDWLEEE